MSDMQEAFADWAKSEIYALRQQLATLERRNGEMRAALREIAVGKIKEDFVSGANLNVGFLTASRLCGIARAALKEP